MKKILLIIGMISIFHPGYGQSSFKITGGNVKIPGVTNIVFNNTDFVNQGAFDAPATTVNFTGTSSNTLESGGATLYHLKINKASGQVLNLIDDAQISHQLEFVADGNKLEVDHFDLTLGAAATIVGAAPNRFIVTESTGRLVKQDLTTFIFPVGFDASTYNPLTLTESGTADAIGVRCLRNVLDGGASGTALSTGVADVSWELSEDVSGGSNLSVAAQWNGTDELADFDRTDSGIMRYHNGDWDLPVSSMGAASGSEPYLKTANLSDLGIIAIAGEERINRVQLAARVFLQGAYSGSQMTDDLRSNNLIPLTEPFTEIGYTHLGRGGGETIASSVLNVTGDDAITDWIFIELRDKNNPATALETCSALIQRDGDIVGLDGVSNIRLPVLDDDYFVAIRHRNHLGIRSPVALVLSKSVPTFHDFTTSLSAAYDDPVIFSNDAMADLGSGVYGLFRADINMDNKINVVDFLLARSNSVPNQPGVYLGADVNLDGNINVVDFLIARAQSVPNRISHY